jgi:hypothetical protein
MQYVLIAAVVFVVSSLLVYLTTHRRYISKSAVEKGVIKAQYFRVLFAVSIFFTLIAMLIIKAVVS